MKTAQDLQIIIQFLNIGDNNYYFTENYILQNKAILLKTKYGFVTIKNINQVLEHFESRLKNAQPNEININQKSLKTSDF